jgi:hypothetical protein
MLSPLIFARALGTRSVDKMQHFCPTRVNDLFAAWKEVNAVRLFFFRPQVLAVLGAIALAVAAGDIGWGP